MSCSLPANQGIPLVHSVTFVGTSIAYELEQTFFKVGTLLLDGVLEVGASSAGEKGSTRFKRHVLL